MKKKAVVSRRPRRPRARRGLGPKAVVDDAIDALAGALEVVDDDAYDRARARSRRVPAAEREPLSKLFQALDALRTTRALGRDSAAKAIVQIVHDERPRTLDQTDLAARVFPHAAAESAASMVSRKLDALERDGFVRRVKQRRARVVELGARGEAYFGIAGEPALRARLEERVKHLPSVMALERGMNDCVRLHLLQPYYTMCRELTDGLRWTAQERSFARILVTVPLDATPDDEARAPFRAAVGEWSDSDPKRLLVELMCEALSPRTRDDPTFPERVAYAGGRIDAASSDVLLWGRLACIAAPRYGAEHRRRVELLERAVLALEGSAAAASSAERRYIQGFAAHALGTWEQARRIFERATEAERGGDPLVEQQVRGAASKNAAFARANAQLLQSFEGFLRAEGAPARWSRGLLSVADREEIHRGRWLDRLAVRSLSQLERCVERFDASSVSELDADDPLPKGPEVTHYYRGMLLMAADPSAGHAWLSGMNEPPDVSEEDLGIMLLDLQYVLPAILLRRSLRALWYDARGDRDGPRASTKGNGS